MAGRTRAIAGYGTARARRTMVMGDPHSGAHILE
jgi:hypothetical protein